ncbi:class I lanthipeptide [Chitinophaga nivalis]|uniref:Class I lanthipeptide n=1 Tax=Chitinophaga nivalis TaxID=2991709 RepID=A0ABT3ILH3_9BACT|nr:class I lanthipeptide [Chitinophaga nivalis]MCW3465548.1 class I lanthipeptide [Chitinophaga nivalis]MCW3484761.1 class I lanthipeptide [Chitinophaga nivalis]
MKKTKVDLNKKLFLSKATVVSLNEVMQQQVAGGAATILLPKTKLSRQSPGGPHCICCADPTQP